jgi:pSer/pThr/pTyr-binding forkhead associated (FHA) protein
MSPQPRPGSKLQLPSWAVEIPQGHRARLIVTKDGNEVEKIRLAGRWFLVLGRNKQLVDQVLEHESISREHAAIAFDGQVFSIIDLGSAQGTRVNKTEIPANKWHKLQEDDVINFAESSRNYSCAEFATKRKRDNFDDTNSAKRTASGPVAVRCRHLLVKHTKSRNPKSWRSPDGVTRSPEEAMDIILDYEARLKSKHDSFEELAKEFSDCSSAKKRGDLGHFKRGQMQPSFEQAA